jgi:3-deoxy-D-manno-octulosonic-acid transferase
MVLLKKIRDQVPLVVYEVALWFIALMYLPRLFYNLLRHKKYRNSLFARLGIGFPTVKRRDVPLVWVHAVSMGETRAVGPLVSELKKLYPEMQLVISSITETGHEEAKRSVSFADHHVYLPFDLSFLAHKVISMTSPDLVIVCESDFWFNFLRHAKNQGAVIALVNGKLSERSTKRFKKIRFFSERLFNLFDVVCLQNQIYYNRAVEMFISPERIIITGNLKLDGEYPELSEVERSGWLHQLGIQPGAFILTIGSTHDPEEALFIDTLKKIWETHPGLKVILVPRHPERFNAVAKLLEKEHVSFIRFTEIKGRTGEERVILVDVMGLLRICYELCDVALVGGSYTDRVGGHNILEPCPYGKPVLFGPYMHTQTEFVNLIKEYGAGFQVSKEELGSCLERLMADPEEKARIGAGGLRLIRESKGAIAKTLIKIKPVLDGIEGYYSRNKK